MRLHKGTVIQVLVFSSSPGRRGNASAVAEWTRRKEKCKNRLVNHRIQKLSAVRPPKSSFVMGNTLLSAQTLHFCSHALSDVFIVLLYYSAL